MTQEFDSMMLRVKTQKLKEEMNKLPKEVKNLGLRFFKMRFRAQGWYDTTFMPWKARKKNTKKNKGRSILVNSGRLRNSIRGKVNGNEIVFGTSVPYAKIHNEGGTITRLARSETFQRNRISRGKNKGNFKKGTKAGQGFSFKGGKSEMPKRQFMGDSAHLRKLVTRTIENKIKRIFQ